MIKMIKIIANVHMQCKQVSEGIDLEINDNATVEEIEKAVVRLAIDGIGFSRIVHYPESYYDVQYEIVDDDGNILVDFEAILKERAKMAKQVSHNKSILE